MIFSLKIDILSSFVKISAANSQKRAEKAENRSISVKTAQKYPFSVGFMTFFRAKIMYLS